MHTISAIRQASLKDYTQQCSFKTLPSMFFILDVLSLVLFRSTMESKCKSLVGNRIERRKLTRQEREAQSAPVAAS